MRRLLGFIVAIAATITADLAMAADLPLTEPPPAPPIPVQSDFSVHGFSDTTLKNEYITPRGLLVTNKGATVQSVDVLIVDVYNNPTSFFTDVSLVGGTFLDLNPGYGAPNTTGYNEIDYFGGPSVKFGQSWTLSAQYLQFDSPQNAFFVERFMEIGLQYDDSGWNKLLPLNPYAKFFYEFKGKSSVVVLGHTETFDVEIGAIPKYALTPVGLPVTLSAPTWFTVGPSEFWGGSSNFGVFSTGLVATVPLPALPSLNAFKPQASLHAGIQYYRVLNNQLLVAQTLVGTAGVNATHPDVFVPSVGINVSF